VLVLPAPGGGAAVKVAFITTDNREPFRQYGQPKPWFGTAPEALLQGFAQLPGIHVHVVSCTQRAMPSSPEKLADNIWFHSLHVPKLGWLRTAYLGCIRAVRRKLRELKPDIVHSQGTERDCGISGAFSGWPNILTLHGNMRLIARLNCARPLSYLWLAARLEAFTVPRTDGVVCISTHTQQAVRSKARRTWLVPNCADQKFFAIDPVRVLPPIILCVGTINPLKNTNALIRALDRLRSGPDFRVHFFGNPEMGTPYVSEFFDLLRSRPWCWHGGLLGREELRKELSRATMLVLPTLEDNCPMAVLEAMASGVPVAASRVGGVPDLIAHGSTGLLFDPLDAESIRRAIGQLLEDGTLRNHMATQAREHALARFQPGVIARRHVEIYLEVLNTSL
jgi:glycosyltransferase involved in cell wall biosynthesis